MVRYARAKGSKASNEKLPEDATPWQVMKKQMLEVKQPKVEPIGDVKAFLNKGNDNEGTTWAKFEETKPIKQVVVKKKDGVKKLGKGVTKVGKDVKNTGIKKLTPVGVLAAEEFSPKDTKEFQKKKKKTKQNDSSESNKNVGEIDAESPMPLHKKKKKKKSESKPTEECLEMSSNSKELELDSPMDVSEMKSWNENESGQRGTTRRNERFRYKGNHRGNQMQDRSFEKRPQKDSFTIRVGSRTVELRYYDNFPVKVEDWERLTELENRLREENVPEDQIRATMKLQRRRAEKALSRERKKVCFNCREPGHVLSECPSIEEKPFGKGKDSIVSNSNNSGMCFKCGSREHTHYECMVVNDDSYKFAKCFICGDQGHISRQCPDNPRGLYPKGGGCSECGDVTHFRKDCPKHLKEKQETVLTVPTLKEDIALEALDGDSTKATQQPQKTPKKTKKVVKF